MQANEAVVRIIGRLRLANGAAPVFHARSAGQVLIDQRLTPYTCVLNEDYAEVSFGVSASDHAELSELVRLAQHVARGAVLHRAFIEGIGIDVQFHQIITDTEAVRLDIDSLGSRSSVSEQGTGWLMHASPMFRWAAQDVNGGLLDRENAPFLFYRSIESLARLVTRTASGENLNWGDAHAVLGTSRSAMLPLERLRQHHAHGDHAYFSKAEHRELCGAVRQFLDAAASACLRAVEIVEWELSVAGATDEMLDHVRRKYSELGGPARP